MTGEAGRDATLRGLLAEIARLRVSEERMRAEVEELRESQQSLEATLQHYVALHELSPMASLGLDSRGNVRTSNRRAAALIGVNAIGLHGLSIFLLLGPTDRRRFVEHTSAAKRSGDVTTFESTLLRGAGHCIPVRLSLRATNEGRISYAVTITDLRERDAALAERDQLAREERQTREDNNSKSLQIARLARGLRAPLAPVLATAYELAERSGLSPELAAPLRELVTAITAFHQRIRRVAQSGPRRARGQAAPKIQLRAQERGHRRRNRAAR